MEDIESKISPERELGIQNEGTLREFQTIIRRMQEEGRIGFALLGCTEPPLLLTAEAHSLPGPHEDPRAQRLIDWIAE